MTLTSKRKKQFTYTSIGAFFLLSGIEYSIILPTLWTYLNVAYHAELFFFGITLSAFPIAGIFSSLIIGRISDITGNTSILLFICNLVQIGGGILYTFAPSVWLLVCGRFLAGIGNGVSSALFGDIAKSVSNHNDLTYIFARFFAIRQFGLIIGPCCYLLLYKISFQIGPYRVYPYNSPGLFIALLWMLHNLMVIFLFYDLKQIAKQECLETMCNENSNLTRTSQNYGAFDNSIDNQNHNGDNIIGNDNIVDKISSGDNMVDKIIDDNDMVDRSYSSSSASDIFLDIAEKCLSNVKIRRLSLPYLDYNRYKHSSHEFSTSSPFLPKCRSEGDILNDEKNDSSTFESENMPHTIQKLKSIPFDVDFKKLQTIISVDDVNLNRCVVQSAANQKRDKKAVDTHINKQEDNCDNDIGENVNDDNKNNVNDTRNIIDDNKVIFDAPNYDVATRNCNKVICYSEYLKPEIIAILATFFMGTFNQASMEALLPLLSQSLLNWGQFEISILFFCAGLEIICVALLLKPISRCVSDRCFVSAGTVLQLTCICILLIFFPNAYLCSYNAKMAILLFVVFIDLIGLPLQLIASTSLFSKLTPLHSQGFGQGVRRIFVGLGLILGPLWSSSLFQRPYILFPTMIVVNCTGLMLIFASYRSLRTEYTQLVTTATDA